VGDKAGSLGVQPLVGECKRDATPTQAGPPATSVPHSFLPPSPFPFAHDQDGANDSMLRRQRVGCPPMGPFGRLLGSFKLGDVAQRGRTVRTDATCSGQPRPTPAPLLTNTHTPPKSCDQRGCSPAPSARWHTHDRGDSPRLQRVPQRHHYHHCDPNVQRWIAWEEWLTWPF
jgi:hypothetical protein